MNNLKQVRDSRNAIAPASAGRRRARSQSSRWNFVNFAVFPDDHRQTAAAKLGPFLPRCALVRLGGDANPFRHFLLRNWPEAVARISHCSAKKFLRSTIVCVADSAYPKKLKFISARSRNQHARRMRYPFTRLLLVAAAISRARSHPRSGNE